MERYGGKYSSKFGTVPHKWSDNKMSKRVRCIETGETFGSASEAAAAKSIDYYHLCENARGKRRVADDGTHWEYLDPPFKKRPQSETAREKRRGGNNGHAKPIVCIETGKYYPASSILADELGVNRPRITKFMQKDGVFNGLHYQYVEKGEQVNGNPNSESQTNPGED